MSHQSLRSLRSLPCPKCGKKKLRWKPVSPHDLRTRPALSCTKMQCRGCHTSFKIKGT